MLIQFSTQPHQFEFLKPAKTSRGEYTEKTSHLISLRSGGFEGIGEAAPLPGLSLDGDVDYHAFTEHLLNVPLGTDDILEHLDLWEPGKDTALPAMRFAMHAAWQHLQHLLSQPSLLNSPKMPSHWVNTPFTQGKTGMKINGLVWMNGINAMYEEAMLKISLGFRCIKIKVGALDFDEECKLIEKLRKHMNAFQLEIRLDANGGFSPDVALEQIKALHRFQIHSIEQPVKARYHELDRICKESKIDIALDEELIGFHPNKIGNLDMSGKQLLSWAKPKYIILKPTLLGGLDLAEDWIRLAENEQIGWWSTSALEGNVGLACIAQWVSKFNPTLPQGLGTGSLFKENYNPQTRVVGEQLWFLP